MQYLEFCRDANGRFSYEKSFEWTYHHVNKEYDAGICDTYAKQVGNGLDEAIKTSFLYECGIRNEGGMTPLVVKNFLIDPTDTKDVFIGVQHLVDRERYQALLDKYIAIYHEFIKRHREWSKKQNEKHSAKPHTAVEVAPFRI